MRKLELENSPVQGTDSPQDGTFDLQTELLWLQGQASTRAADGGGDLLKLLLQDRTTGKNILWGTDIYADLGEAWQWDREITPAQITDIGHPVIQTRVQKGADQQQARTRQHAEVFTPLWICDRMNGYLDDIWFHVPGKFRKDGQPTERVRFTQKHKWTTYVDRRCLEITCGEAPFLVSRYDAATGEPVPIRDRVGLLDRKLRAVNENAVDEAEWWFRAQRAFQASYGYELQGDSLLIARINLLLTFEEYYRDRWQKSPTGEQLKTIAQIIVWNIWQMNGLTGAVPGCVAEAPKAPAPPEDAGNELALWDMTPPAPEADPAAEPAPVVMPCRLRNWQGKQYLTWQEVNRKGKQGGKRIKMKFDFVIGNPPYQDENDNSTRKPPIYNLFMSETFNIADRVELITPARFLFNAGQTPRNWNNQMLNDQHFKVLYYEPDALKIFPNVLIKGGVAISYRDANQDFGSIGTFTTYPELNCILKKVKLSPDFTGLDCIIASRGNYRLSESFFEDFPDASQRLGRGTANMVVSNIFEKIPEAFSSVISNDNEKYIALTGRENNRRVIRYLLSKYLKENPYLSTYNVLVPEANGTGAFGETLSSPFISIPGECATDTFISIGTFDGKGEADAALLYIKTRFARAMLGVKKATQHNPKSAWEAVPLQDFTPASDIDWTQSIADIDRQLYAKYGLDTQEIEFIESHVKEMT